MMPKLAARRRSASIGPTETRWTAKTQSLGTLVSPLRRMSAHSWVEGPPSMWPNIDTSTSPPAISAVAKGIVRSWVPSAVALAVSTQGLGGSSGASASGSRSPKEGSGHAGIDARSVGRLSLRQAKRPWLAWRLQAM